MKQKGFQKFISVLLALVLTLGLALPAMAADGSGEQGSKLSFEQVSADEYNVGLSRRDEVSTEETEEPLYEDTDVVRVSIVLEDASTLEGLHCRRDRRFQQRCHGLSSVPAK